MILTSWYSHPSVVPSHIFAQLVCVTNKALQSDRSLCPYEIRSLKEMSFHFGRLCSPQSSTEAELGWHAMRTFSHLWSGPKGASASGQQPLWKQGPPSREQLRSRFFSLHLVLFQTGKQFDYNLWETPGQNHPAKMILDAFFCYQYFIVIIGYPQH